MSEPVLRVEREEAVALLTLNRPQKMNALSAELRLALGSAFREIQADPGIRAAVLTGEGRAFCAGMDLEELASGAPGASGFDTSAAGQDEMAQGIACFEGPIIAAVNGHAVTGGFELALACDLIVASSRAKFADTHARVGILPGWGLSQKLPRLVGLARAKEISLSGNAIGAAQAYEWGLVNRVVEPHELLPACRALARDMASWVPGIVEAYKRLIDEGYGMPLPEALAHERAVGTASARAASAAAVGERREQVLARGRRQGGAGED
jgi:enoyl-CoA hydratase